MLCEKAIVRLPAVKIITVSKSSVDDLIRFGVPSDKIAMVPNAIDINGAENHESQYENFALFLWRLVEYKNVDVIIKAFEQVVHALPDARLVIAGDGPERHRLEKLVRSIGLAGNIVFEGYVSENRKEELLRTCSMLLFPSLIEGFGIVLLEAFAHNKPAIVANVRPLSEVVDDNVDGFTLEPTSPSSWAEKIICLLKDKSLSTSMGNRGRSKVETKFDITDAAESLELIYEEALAAQKIDRQNQT